jgi:serine phosphatase RsbU (regulator of sigma subunit)
LSPTVADHPSRILVVDDNQVNRKLLVQNLSLNGHLPDTAEDGEQALEKMHSESFDLVLLDIEMPRLDGFQTLAALKQDTGLRHIPVIMITAVDEMESAVRCIEMGAEDYLPKPFNPILLKARIDASLEKKHLRDAEQLYLRSLEREFEIAHEIQMDFLPAELPRLPGWDIAAYFKAARIVAGDFYDVFELLDGKVGLVIADVCDKGVGAALFMTLFRSLIRASATTDYFTGSADSGEDLVHTRLRHAITLTNNYIAETHGEKGMFATIFFGILDPHSGKIAYINCGHEPPLIFNRLQVFTALDKTGPAVGILTDASFRVAEAELLEGDLFLAFTDGVPDTENKHAQEFGRKWITEVSPDQSATSVLHHVETELHKHMAGADQFDDITLLAVRRVNQP